MKDVEQTRNTARESIKNITAGTLGTIIAKAVCQPLDVIKVRLQVYPTRYKSPFGAAYELITEQGISSLWKGHVLTQSSGLAQGTTLFLFYEQFYYSLSYPGLDARPNLKTFICGYLTGTISIFMTAPFELVKTQLMANDNAKQSGGIKTAIRVFRERGISGLYRGCMASMIQVGPLLGARFMTYNLLCKHEMKYFTCETKEELPSTLLFINGALAGVASILLTQPLDVLKRRIQMEGFKAKTGTTVTSCHNIFGCVLQTFENEGLHGFFRGMGTNIVKSALLTSLTFTCFDKIKLMLNKLDKMLS